MISKNFKIACWLSLLFYFFLFIVPIKTGEIEKTQFFLFYNKNSFLFAPEMQKYHNLFIYTLIVWIMLLPLVNLLLVFILERCGYLFISSLVSMSLNLFLAVSYVYLLLVLETKVSEINPMTVNCFAIEATIIIRVIFQYKRLREILQARDKNRLVELEMR